MTDKSLRKIERIESNDPDVLTLAIGSEGYSPHALLKEWENEEYKDEEYEVLHIEDDRIDWKRVCTAIQRSKVLEELHLGGIEIVPNGNDSNFRENDLRALMVAFANSGRQLRKLALNMLSVPFEILFNEDCSGVLQKSGFCLNIMDCDVVSEDIDVLTDHISRGDNLVRFEFVENGEGLFQGPFLLALGLLIRHLSNHHQLEVLSIIGAGLHHTSITDIASMLSRPDTKLVGLELEGNGIGVNEFNTIMESLSTNKTLRGLSYDNFNGAAIGAQLIDRLLSLKDLPLKLLSTNGVRIADPEAAMLSKRFNSYGKLTYLQLDLGTSLTMSGWNALGEYIQSSRCILDQLNLPHSNLDDAKLQSLSTWISSHGTIKYLHLWGNRAITVDGWRVFFHLVLENPKSKMTGIDISRCGIKDETINSLASALRRNCTLEEFQFFRGEDDEIDVTEEGWDYITTVLCNETSIMETYLSNHTLIMIETFDPLPADLTELLDFNRKFPRTVARLKVLDVHFGPEFDMNAIRPFLTMDMKLLPQVINWIGKGEEFVKQFWTVMYELVRHSQLFVEHGADHSAYSKMRSPMKKRKLASSETAS
ncbi:hypothetical protein THAOC_35917 [Thalassiosira oceanica]|uniref:Uncharacterized protein n=1 Tax=Thalassiosira oceanica TaxID=159749 RepID=K0R977_THAOC|nr:hypothetical protein THAOC_35917 [Thalassiosira oceanica]|eukprot:EJK45466.1 hypothetical protein THAOC_35917 [Thalassiosira oceanica]